MYSNRVDLPMLARAVFSHRALLEMLTEAYQSALVSSEASLAIETAPGTTPDIAAARAHLACGWSSLQGLRLDRAAAEVRAFDATPRELLDPLLLVYGRLLRACVLLVSGQVEDARRLLDGRGDVPELLPWRLERLDGFVRLLIGLAMGDRTGLEVQAHNFRASGLAAEAALGEAVAVGLGGDEQRAVRMLDTLLQDPARGAVAVPLGSAVALGAASARVAFLDRIGAVESVEAAGALVPDLLSRAAPQRMLWMLTPGPMISPGFVDLIETYAATADCHPIAAEAAMALRDHPPPYPDLTPHRSGNLNGLPGSALGYDDARGVLTPREHEVLSQLALGGGNADVARSLFVSENTVKTHLASIYRKLEVDRRSDALRVARSLGLL
jgi:DNA-binding CsgD family transcriptional regulator